MIEDERGGVGLMLLRALGRYVPLRGRDRIIRAFKDPDQMHDHSFVAEFFGMKYPGNLNRFIDWSVYFHGAYSRHELELLGDIARLLTVASGERPIAYDIGANVGHHALFLAGVCSRVIAFEPLEANARLISEKITLNRLDNLDVLVMALGDVEAEVEINFPDPTRSPNSGTASLHADYNPVNNIMKSRVRMARCDDIAREQSLPLPEIVKIDVEGHEKAVLAGMTDLLSTAAPVMLLEASEFTWKTFGSRDGLQTFLGDAELFAVEANKWTGRYRLRALPVGEADELLIVPSSRRASLASILP
ncbi:MAG: FkbM family methyltransferase [Rhodospirillaceae bacterium]|jgi:FkbM family methyltransferase|nr:FkbM family methyltransferase [Rhodospirillaceae bacterium]